MAYADEWYCSAAITIDQTKCGGVLNNFVVYLNEDNLPDEMLDADGQFPAKAAGGDIRFSQDAAGVTPMPFHIVEFTQNNNPALASANIWVGALVSDVADKVIYVWWRNADADALPIADTYGQYETWKYGTECYARWMCDDNQDASENNVDFLATDVTFTAGKIDDCAVFDEDESAEFTYVASQEYIWWTGWIYVDSGVDEADGLFDCPPFFLYIALSGAGFKLRFQAGFSDTVGRWRAEVELAFDTWHHVSIGYDGRLVANNPTWAINAAAPAQVEESTPVGVLDGGSTTGYLGRLTPGGRQFPGQLDEIYLKLLDPVSAAVHLEYEVTQFNNQDDPASFASPGPMLISKRSQLRV